MGDGSKQRGGRFRSGKSRQDHRADAGMGQGWARGTCFSEVKEKPGSWGRGKVSLDRPLGRSWSTRGLDPMLTDRELLRAPE